MSVFTHKPTNIALRKERIFIRYQASDWQESWPLHTHDGFEFYFFHQGNASFIIGNEIYPLMPGDMLLISGDVLHRPNPTKEVPYIRSYINFTLGYIQEYISEDMSGKLLSMFQMPNGMRIRWEEGDSEEIDRLIQNIYKEREKESIGHDFMMKTQLIQLLFIIYRKMKATNDPFVTPHTSQKEANVRQILIFINQHYKESITLDGIAEAMFLNKYYMCHCFKEVTGDTINNYLAGKRIAEAKKMLRTTDELIGQMSEKLGFGNSVHFSRLFKQHLGVSPQNYRKLNQN